MSKRKDKASSPPTYEDFITVKPEVIKSIGKQQMDLLKEHSEILVALIGKNMTVKEIHRLFLIDPDEGTYTKTLKTVYRHLDSLEEAELVRVAGHRKYEGSRQIEKLYCRGAIVFFQEEDTGPRWWETEEGQKRLRTLSLVVVEYFGTSKEKASEFQELLQQYYELWDNTVMSLFEETAKNETIADLFSDVDIYDLKDIARIIGMMGAFLNRPDFSTRFAEILEKS